MKKPRAKGTKRSRMGYPKRDNHNVPDKYDELLRQDELKRLSKKLDDKGRPKPITEQHLVALCVKAVREKWMSCDNKLHFLLSKQLWDTDPKSKTIKLWECNQCKELFKFEEINIDHIRPAGSATNFEDFKVWAGKILNAGGEEDLQVLCEPCHKIKNVVESHNVSWEDAIKLKKLIEKLDKPAKEQQKELTSLGFDSKMTSNAEKRKQCYLEAFERGDL